MGGQGVVVHAWKEWGIQALVLLSFTLQVTLLVLAEFRRRVRSGVLMFFTWSAYMMADATAIYVLGHMSVTSSRRRSQLVAFWAPFLLLHLGGQDNITAYAIEDNRLWLRHLQALVVQVAAAAYVLYESSIISGDQPLLRWATILMFLVGAIKYGERVLALWWASTSSARRNYRTYVTPDGGRYRKRSADEVVSKILKEGKEGSKTTEAHVLLAHRMLDVPKSLLKGSRIEKECYRLFGARLYKVVEMQLSLMHDIFYTKTQIIHCTNWYGICIRMISAVATTIAFVLFHRLVRNDKGTEELGYNRVDVVVTYVLLAGALVLETLSLLRAAFSCWTRPYMQRWEDETCTTLLAYTVPFVRLLVRAADYWRGSRNWSASMGQHNLLQLATRSRASLRSKVARWMGLEDLWNTLAYSWSIPVSPFIEDKLMNQLFHDEIKNEIFWAEQEHKRMRGDGGGREEEAEEVVLEVNEREPEEEGDEVIEDQVVLEGPDPGEEAEALSVWDLEQRPEVTIDQVIYSRVPEKLESWGLYMFGLTRSLEERILAWHIATNIYLTWWYKEEHGNKEEHQQSNKLAKVRINALFHYLKSKIKFTKAEAYKVEHSNQPNAEVVEALSNYMVFLLAARPDMVSATGSRTAYLELCYALTHKGPECDTAEELARRLEEVKSYGEKHYYSHFAGYDHGWRYEPPLSLRIGCKLGAMLIRKHTADTLDMIAQAWVETLCHAAQGCSAYAHTKELSNGGELITVAAILVHYLNKDFINAFGDV